MAACCSDGNRARCDTVPGLITDKKFACPVDKVYNAANHDHECLALACDSGSAGDMQVLLPAHKRAPPPPIAPGFCSTSGNKKAYKIGNAGKTCSRRPLHTRERREYVLRHGGHVLHHRLGFGERLLRQRRLRLRQGQHPLYCGSLSRRDKATKAGVRTCCATAGQCSSVWSQTANSGKGGLTVPTFCGDDVYSWDKHIAGNKCAALHSNRLLRPKGRVLHHMGPNALGGKGALKKSNLLRHRQGLQSNQRRHSTARWLPASPPSTRVRAARPKGHVLQQQDTAKHETTPDNNFCGTDKVFNWDNRDKDCARPLHSSRVLHPKNRVLHHMGPERPRW